MTKRLKFFGADLESTGLLHHLREQGDKARIHNFALMSTTSDKFMILHPMKDSDRQKLQNILDRDDTVLVMHNGICYDMEALKFFGFDTSKVKIVDTLYLAWYLDFFKENPRYGLEQYGVELGFPKPPIENWEDLTQEEYDNRVYGDINIQKKLWLKLCNQFAELYNIPKDDMLETNVYNHHAMKYIMWKGEQLRQQQENQWKFNIEEAQPLLDKIEAAIEEKFTALKEVMPKVPVYKVAKRPSKPFKANGDMSAAGVKWDEICKKNGYTFNAVDEVKYVASYKEPNPASPQQVKDWLYDLGWVPETFEFKKDDGVERKIPQVYVKNSGGMVCHSVEALAEEYPEVAHLVGMGVYKHRRGMVQGWINNHDNGYLTARAQGFTNTLRLKHAELVNLPSGRVLLGEEIRGLLTVREEGNILLGSDLSSLENRLKFHFQMPLDPEYVKAQMSDDFDPHLAIAVMAGLLTEDEMNFYKVVDGGFPAENYITEGLAEMLAWSDAKKESEVKRIAKIRGIGKGGNYSCQYGAGAKTVARTTKTSLEVGKMIVEGYREMNWSIDVIASNTSIKKTSFGDFQLNPLNRIYYPLKTAKDRFSTLIQGSGSYVLDLWLMFIRKRINQAMDAGLFAQRPMLLATYHDEIILEIKEIDKQLTEQLVDDAIEDCNKAMKLHVDLACDIQFGYNYSEIH